MEFRTIKSLDNLYEISNTGILRNTKTQKVVKGHTEKNGYQRVRIENKALGKVVRTTIHQLVAEAFIPNPEGKPQVNHIDLNKQNNNASNLEWVTASENMKHAYMNGIGVDELAECRNRHKKQVSNGLHVFESISEAGQWLLSQGKCKNKNSGIAGISAVLRNKRNTFGGYEWKVVS
jgi:hypothetical protein